MRHWLPILALIALAAPVQARTPGELTVRVIGKTSRAPVAGIRVSLRTNNDYLSGAPKHENVERTRGDLTHDPITSASGLVVFADLGWFNGYVIARGETGAGYLKDVLVTEEGRREIVLELAQGDDAHVVGRVLGPAWDQPVSNARILVLEAQDDATLAPNWKPRELFTKSDGSFEFDYPSWKNIYMRVDAEGCSPGLAAPCDRHKDAKALSVIRLEYPAALDVRVIDTSGAGVVGAEVRATVGGMQLYIASDHGEGRETQPGFWLPLQTWTCTTDADGRAHLAGLPRTRLKLDVCKDGRVLRDEPGAYRVPYEDVLALEFKIGATTQVGGLVLDQTGKPVADAEIWVERWEGERGRYPYDHPQRATDVGAKTDAAGRFVLPAVLPGKWWIGPAPAHWDPTPVPPTDCPGPPKEISTDLAPGSEVLETNGEASRELTLHVARALFVRGIVIDSNGKPLPKCAVGVTDAHNLFGRGAETGLDGRFVLGPVPDLPLFLHSSRTEEHAPTDFVEVRAGDPDVTLAEQPSSCVRAFVVDANSGEGCFAQIFVRPLEAAPGVLRTLGTPVAPWSWSNEDFLYGPRDGHFARRFVQPGKYAIGAATQDGRFAFATGLDAPAGGVSEEVVLALKPGGRLRVVYRGKESGVHLSIAAGGVPGSFRLWVRRGVWEELPAPAGSFQLEIRNVYDGPARSKTLELNVGESKDVVLTDEG